MKRNRGAVNYATGMATSRVSLINMYIYGASIISLFTLLVGMVFVQDLTEVIHIWFEWYALKLIPWPIDELLKADTISDLIFSHAATIGVGITVAALKWRARV